MAKKTVATLKKEGGVGFTKVIRPIKNEKGAYSFLEDIVPNDRIKDLIDGKIDGRKAG